MLNVLKTKTMNIQDQIKIQVLREIESQGHEATRAAFAHLSKILPSPKVRIKAFEICSN